MFLQYRGVKLFYYKKKNDLLIVYHVEVSIKFAATLEVLS